eukprot:TRINITY_DN2831_c0_g4_i1.p1 TRINITY_DN2831_c0_g4~~TRINITY_DN2831_c0_g4_i1.p1  ORF type:complete len:745 (-),score=197.60 TRINITY_DN2831_c0_g4_i1:176-2410(-)
MCIRDSINAEYGVAAGLTMAAAAHHEDPVPAGPSSPGPVFNDNSSWRGASRDVMGVTDGVLELDEVERRTFGEEDREESCGSNIGWLRLNKTAKKFFPPLQWVPVYSSTDLKGDLISGITVGCMLVPQSMAYAVLADLPPVNGLYSSFVGLLVYALFGTSRQLGLGPVAVVSLMVSSTLNADDSDANKVQQAAQLSFVVGMALTVLGLLRAGVMVNFISHSVMSAFTSAAGITIGASQFKHLFGLEVPRYDRAMVFQTTVKILSNLDHANGYAVIQGFSAILFLILLRLWKSSHPTPPEGCKAGWWCLRMLADFSALVVAAVWTSWAFLWNKGGINVPTVGDIPSGYSSPSTDSIPSFTEMEGILIVSVVIAMVGYLESMSVSQIMASKFQYRVDANQELLAIGAANVIASFFGAFPTVGSFSRTAVHGNVGARTNAAGAISAFVVFGSLYFLTTLFVYLPYSALAAMIEVAVLNLVDIQAFVEAYKLHKRDFVVMLVTFTTTLGLGVKEGLFTGICLSILLVVQHSAFPRCSIHGRRPTGNYRDVARFPDAVEDPRFIIVCLHAKIFFANANRFGAFVTKAILRAHSKALELEGTPQKEFEEARRPEKDELKWLILDARAITDIDLSGLHVLHGMSKSLEKKNDMRIVMCNASDKVRKQVQRAEGVMGHVLFTKLTSKDTEDAVEFCLNHSDPEAQDGVEANIVHEENTVKVPSMQPELQLHDRDEQAPEEHKGRLSPATLIL